MKTESQTFAKNLLSFCQDDKHDVLHDHVHVGFSRSEFKHITRYLAETLQFPGKGKKKKKQLGSTLERLLTSSTHPSYEKGVVSTRRLKFMDEL